MTPKGSTRVLVDCKGVARFKKYLKSRMSSEEAQNLITNGFIVTYPQLATDVLGVMTPFSIFRNIGAAGRTQAYFERIVWYFNKSIHDSQKV